MKKYLVFALVIMVSGCFKEPEIKFRMPASGESLSSLEGIIESLGKAVSIPVNSSTQCSTELEKYYISLFSLTSADVDLDKFDSKKIHELISTSFKTRIEMRNKLKDLVIKTDVDKKCLENVRATVRALRYVEDYLVEVEEFSHKESVKVDYATFSGEAPYFLVNKKFKFTGVSDLKGGDVILSRGNAYSSAAIARIGTADAQFSHLSLVHEDENGNLFTSEAHIEVGSLGEPIQKHVDQGNARTVVFRFKDPVIAQKAGEIMYKKVRARQEQKKNIKYDFGMNYQDNSDLFCSEIIYDGYRQASDGELDVPVFKTKFNRGLLPFLEKLGVNVDETNVDSFETFGPGDIEFDSRFELVAEWRNPARMRDTRTKDLVLTKLFEWMEEEGYKFHPPGKVKRKAWFSWVLRRTPVIALALRGKFPKYMTRDQLRLFLLLDEVAIVLQDRVDRVQEEYGKPMTPIEIYKVLDDFKEEDFARYEVKPKKSKFHRNFHP